MNLFKLAFRNIRKSSRDYSIYFFTLVIGIAIFYMFNSVGTQSFFSSIATAKAGMLGLLKTVISVISVGVAVVLGILITYANNFLIKRRKKEFGVYMMLGMNEKKVSAILSIETLIVGVVSLAVGLVVGILGSQLFSIIIGKLFEADLSAYRFSFSGEVAGKTLLYFAIIFLVVLVFNARTLSKYKLIDLLNSRAKAEKKLIKNPKVSFVLFIITILVLIFCYVEIGFRGNDITKWEFMGSIIAGFVGTFLFFISLAGFLPTFLKIFKNFYFKELNMFISSQFEHNLNSSAVSFAVICLMLFVAISAFSVGFSMNGYLNNKLKNATPVDITIYREDGKVSDYFAAKGEDAFAQMKEYLEIPVYFSEDMTMKATVGADFDRASAQFRYAAWDTNEPVLRVSDYNKIEALYGRKPIEITDNKYAVINASDILTEFVDTAIKKGNTINVGDLQITSGLKSSLDEFIIMSSTSVTMGAVIVADNVFELYPERFIETGSVFAGNYAKDSAEDVFWKVLGDTEFAFATKADVQAQSVSSSVTVVFIVLYIGIIFIITSAAVIALKILSDSMDSVEKYAVLMKVGAEYSQRSKALFFQILCNFLLPFVLGLIDSIFALMFAKGLLKAIGMTKMFSGTVIAVAVMVLVYGGYFFVTFRVCKRIVITEKIQS